MNPEKWRKVDEIFQAAIQMPPERRGTYCDRACGADSELRNELDRMLAGHEQANGQGFLERPAWLPREPEHKEDAMIGKKIDRYEIISRIGDKSGMGDVYLAREMDQQGKELRKVVVKFALERQQEDEKARKRFEDEVRILAAFKHIHIARIYTAGVFHELPYFVMEHVEGTSLSQYLKQNGSGKGLPLHIVQEITKQACAGLKYAHDKGVIHRDIKPQNIMLEREGESFSVKLIDFGIAKATFGGTRSATQGAIGTPHYMAPEQIDPDHFGLVDYRADLYAMGLVVYEMLTGRMVIQGGEITEIIHKQLKVMPPPPAIQPDIDAAVMKAISKEQNQRQASIAEFSAQFDKAIQSYFGGTEILPSPSPAPQSLRRTAILTAALAVALTGAGIGWRYFPGNRPVGSVTSATPAVSPTMAASPPPAIAEQVRLPEIALYRKQGNGPDEMVSQNTVFRSRENVRFTVKAPHNGFLYLLQQGSSGAFSVLFPGKKSGKNNAMAAGKMVEQGYFEFDNKPGEETIYIFFTKDKTTDPLALAIDRSIRANRLDPMEQVLLDEGAAKMLRDAAQPPAGKPETVTVLRLRHEK